MRRAALAIAAACAVACPPAQEPAVLDDASPTGAPTAAPAPTSTPDDWPTYVSPDGALRLRHPLDWRVHRANAADVTEVINVLPEAAAETADLPRMIHAEADRTFVSVFPNAFGTELPASDMVSLDEAELNLSVSLAASASRALRLENGRVWGWYLRFADPPAAWDDKAFVYAQIAVRDFEARCTRDGESVALEDCDPMMGDEVRRSGELDEMARAQVLAVLQSIRLEASTSTNTRHDRRIEVDAPSPGRALRSPVVVRGRARGPWYFEGDFPVRLVDAKGREIATAVASAQGPWMTEAWVPFEATMEFDAPRSKRGTLVFEKDNPSGRPELDAEHRVPVLFAEPR